MSKPALPLYKTGWLYLLLVFWLVCYQEVSADVFAQINQLNFQLYPLDHFTTLQVQPLNLANTKQGFWITLLHVFCFIVGVSLLWYLRGLSPKRQWQCLAAFFLILTLSQYLFLLYGFWFSLAPTITILSCSWLFFRAYQKEYSLFLAIEEKYNQLVVDSLEAISSIGELEQIKHFLERVKPNPSLVEKIFQLANSLERSIDSNTDKNGNLNNSTDQDRIRYIYTWITTSGIPHQPTQDKLQGYLKKSLHLKTESLISSKTGKSATHSSVLNDRNTAQNYTISKVDAPNIHKIPWGSLTPNKKEQAAQQVSTLEDDQLAETLVISSNQSSTIDLENTTSLESTQILDTTTQQLELNPSLNYLSKTFGRYKVEGLLGKGAMGIVYQGIDPKINRHVAIKTLQLSDSIDQEEITKAKQRFFREAETAGSLSHANIVTIYDVGDEDSLGYIAMDLLTGAPLSHFINRNKLLPVPLVYQLMIQITDALDYAHRQNVVHRDIKPGNIIYDDDLQKVTITDFGIACVNDNSRTSTSVIMGSPYYMSPEQILGKQVDGRSDIFSLGATLYQLLSGCLPFEGDSVVSVVYQISNGKHIAITKQNDCLPPSALRITNKALQKDIEKRYQSMQEFKQALINALKRDFKQAPLL